METAIILPGFLNIGCRLRLGSYYTLRDHTKEACLSQTSVANISLFCIGAEATWEIIWTAESWSWWQLACSVHSVLALSRLCLYSAERSLASCHPRCLVSCSNTDSQQHDVRVIKQHEEIFRVIQLREWLALFCQERRLPWDVGCTWDFDLRSRFMTFDDSQHFPHSAPSHHMVLSSRCPLDLCKSLYSSLYTPLYTIWRSGARFHARSVSS